MATGKPISSAALPRSRRRSVARRLLSSGEAVALEDLVGLVLGAAGSGRLSAELSPDDLRRPLPGPRPSGGPRAPLQAEQGRRSLTMLAMARTASSGKGVVGDPVLLEVLDPFGHVHDPHEGADDRLVDPLADPGHDRRRLLDVGHRLRREDDDAPCPRSRLRARAGRPPRSGRAGVADDVDRVAERRWGAGPA